MSEVLSQSEIDALLYAIRTGEIDPAAEQRANAHPRVRVYDFRRAMRFSKDHLRVLRRMYEHFCRLLTSQLSGQLRSVPQIQVESVDQVPYDEFIRSIPPLTVLQVYDMHPLEGRMVMEMNPQVVFAMLDKYMGGDSAGPYRVRELTDIEVSLFRRLFENVPSILAEAWKSVIDLDPQFVSLESNPQFLQLTTPNETVLVVTISVRVGETTGLINLCIPHVTIEPVLSKLSNRYYMDPAFQSGRRQVNDELRAKLLSVPVDVRVEVGQAELTVREVLDLCEGDTIVLRQTIRDPALVYVDGRPAFWGSVGKRNRVYAVKIVGQWEADADGGR